MTNDNAELTFKNWHEDDVFWRAILPVLFSEQRLADAPYEAHSALALAGITEPIRILDQAVGVGRHAAVFSDLGHQVTGIDRTAHYLTYAKKAAPDAEILPGDMRRFCRAERYDLVVNLFTSFGFFSDDENLDVAKNALASLRQGGAYIIDVAGKEVVAQGFESERYFDDGKTVLLEKISITDDWERVRSEWTIIAEDGERHNTTIDPRLFSGVELKRVLHDAGFTSVTLYGSWEGAPYDLFAQRLIAVARR